MAASDVHPLGFVKRNVVRAFGYRIRLHVWTEPQPHRHSHRWPFVGVPLVGRFADYRWTEAEGVTHTRYDCVEPTDGQRPPLTNPQPRALTFTGLYLRRPLVPYLCRLGEVHAFEPVGPGRHVSLVLIGRKRSTMSYVYQEAPDGGE